MYQTKRDELDTRDPGHLWIVQVEPSSQPKRKYARQIYELLKDTEISCEFNFVSGETIRLGQGNYPPGLLPTAPGINCRQQPAELSVVLSENILWGRRQE